MPASAGRTQARLPRSPDRQRHAANSRGTRARAATVLVGARPGGESSCAGACVPLERQRARLERTQVSSMRFAPMLSSACASASTSAGTGTPTQAYAAILQVCLLSPRSLAPRSLAHGSRLAVSSRFCDVQELCHKKLTEKHEDILFEYFFWCFESKSRESD